MSNIKLVAHQMELERLFSKNQLKPRIEKEFREYPDFNFAEYMQKHAIDIDFGFALLVEMALHKRCNLPTLVGLLRPYCTSGQHTVACIEKAARADLLDWSPDLEIFIVKFTISQDVQDEIDRYQYPLPMVVEPKEITHNLETGYFLSRNSVILKNNHTSADVCLDHLNSMNKIKFTICEQVSTLIKNRWRNLDKAKEGESREDFERRKKAFEKYDRTSHDVMKFLLKEGNQFHLTHRYCKRGRTYCQGYHVNYQGTPWNKAVILFADKEIIP